MTSPDNSVPILLNETTPNLNTWLNGVITVHAHCIIHDGTLATFRCPLSFDKMRAYWLQALEQVTAGTRWIMVSIRPMSARTAQHEPKFEQSWGFPSSEPITIDNSSERYEIAGVISLAVKTASETGPQRGGVEKLFVSPNHRQRGIAKQLMRMLEQIAREQGRWSLLLDTIGGTDAELVYPKLGWTKLGVLPDHGTHPWHETYVDEVFFYKDLRKSPPL